MNASVLGAEAPLAFQREAEEFFERWKSFRSVRYRRLVCTLASRLDLDPRTELIVAMPVHVLERGLEQALRSYPARGTRVQIVTFLNEGRGGSRVDYARALGAHRVTISRVRRERNRLRISTLENQFERAGMGEIRGVLWDAIALKAYRLGMRDPIVVSADADQTGTASRFLGILSGAFRADRLLDAVMGEVYYSSHRARPRPELECPEIFLGAELARSRHAVVARGGGDRFLSLCGNSFAMRLSSYLAIGGFREDLFKGEDAELGWRLQHVAAQRKVVYLPSAFVAVSPRRGLDWILQGRRFSMQWTGFERTSGASLDETRLKRLYEKGVGLLRARDLLRASRGDRGALARVKARVAEHFAQSAQVDSLCSTPGGARSIARAYGLNLSEVRYKNGRVERVKINWRKSTILAKLLKRPIGASASRARGD
jgi:hypothetical protein